MVQSVLFLLLGFLSATLLALLIAPAIWRRAVVLTRRRIEASVPMSLNELRAGKDQARAEAAIAIRRLEIRNKNQNEKSVVLKTEISKRLDEIKQLNDENNDQAGVIENLEADVAALNAKLASQLDDNEKLAAKLTSACDQIEIKIAENEHIARLHDEASLVSSNRQIDLVASEARVEKLSGEVDALKQLRDEMETQLRDLSAEFKITERTSQLKDQKLEKLESKLEKVVAALSDSEEKLDRREKELQRLKDNIKQQSGQDDELRRKLEQAEKELTKAETKLTRLTEGSVLTQDEAGNELEAKVGKLEEDKSRLEARLKKIVAENRRLKSANGSAQSDVVADPEGEKRENAELRAQINHLAAEIVNLTVMLDGPNSEISRIIREGKGRNGSVSRSSSIADRVRALREAALSAHRTGVE